MRGIVWLRRDLRLNDNVALHQACLRCESVAVCFVLDPTILRGDRVGAPIVQAFFSALDGLREQLRSLGSDLAVLRGDPAEQLSGLADRLRAQALFYNCDYDPAAINRDRRVTERLRARGIDVRSSLDHVYFGADDIKRNDGEPYRVYTPYRNRWLERHRQDPRCPVRSAHDLPKRAAAKEIVGETLRVPVPEDFGYKRSPLYPSVNESLARKTLAAYLLPGGVCRYRDRRNFPALDATSHLSSHLRAGTLGIREFIEKAFGLLEVVRGDAVANVETWIDQLIWREFYQMVLRRFPHVATDSFLSAGDRVEWRSDEAAFTRWCAGETGYPMVDAAMRQLNDFGWVHNRLRMVAASFLSKHLLIDWRRGERYFEQRLADADLAQNNGGWQWAASTGTDAAPYFRIFNPVRQGQAFDPDGVFVRAMLPPLRAVPSAFVHAPWRLAEPPKGYPPPIVDHEQARTRAVATFARAFRKREKAARP